MAYENCLQYIKHWIMWEVMRFCDTMKIRLLTYSVSMTPSKFQLTGYYDWWKFPVRCHRESLQDYALLHFTGSHNGNGVSEYSSYIWILACTVIICSPKNVRRMWLDNHLSLVVGSRFLRAKLLRTGRTSSVAGAFGRRAWRQPSANFPVPPKFGYSVRALWSHTCLISLYVRSPACTKNGFPDHEAQRSFTRGKRIETSKLKGLCE